MLKKLLMLPLLVVLAAPAVTAAPIEYDFDHSSSKIEFTYDFTGQTVTGGFPKFDADLIVDFQNVRNSSVDVTIDTATAVGGFVFATSALRGGKVLDSKQFPAITFKSTSASLQEGKATLHGLVTVKGISKPVTLQARFFQLQGHAPEDRDELLVKLTTSVNRHDFGASGYPDMVGDKLDITITAKIKKRP